MKTTKKIVSVFLAVLMALSVFSVSLTAFAATKKVTKVTISKTSATVYTTKTLALTAKVSPSNASNKKVKWSTSDKKVATVDSNGVVKGVKAGKATITVKAADGSGKTATCKVTVKKFVKISSLKMNSASKALDIGKTVTLKAAVSPSNASITTYKWTSSNKKVATVDSNGVVKGVKAGTATITATSTDGSNKKTTCKVTVSRFVTGIKLNKTSASLYPNKTVTLTAAVSPSDATTKAVKWTSSNTKVATVDSKGVVKALKAGTATITAAAKDASGKKATCSITVNAYVTGVTLNKTKATVYPGKSITLTATVAPSNAGNKTVKWTSSNTNVATVDMNTGVVKGVKAGTAVITATAKDGTGKKATCNVTVGTYVSGITLSSIVDKEASWYVGKTAKIDATFTPSNATNKKVTWKSSEPECITVDANGNVKVVKNEKTVKGFLGRPKTEKVTEAKITATAADGSGKSATYTVKLKDFVALTGVGFEGSAPSVVYIGQSTLFKTVIAPENASERGVTYKSSNNAVATVDANGIVKGIKAGTVDITATSKYDSKKSVIRTVTVKPVTIECSIPAKRTFYSVGERVTIKCITTPEDALSKLGSRFESANSSIASITPYEIQSYAFIDFKNVGKTKIRVSTKGNEAISPWVDVEVRDIRADQSFFQEAEVGKTYDIDVYLFNGSKVPLTEKDSGIEPVLGEFAGYFDVEKDETTGKFRVTVRRAIPDSGAYITFKASYSMVNLEMKVSFINDKFVAPSGSTAELLTKFKDYSKIAATLNDAVCEKTVKYSDTVVDKSKSKTDMTVKAPITLGQEVSLSKFIEIIGSVAGDDADELLDEMSPEVMIKDLFSESTEEKTNIGKGSYPGAITVDAADVSSITVINNDKSSTYQMKLTLKDQPSVKLDAVNSSAYGKTMKVIDKTFINNYAAQLDISGTEDLGSDAKTSLTFGPINQVYSGGTVVYTIDKLTDKVLSSEYHYKSSLDVQNTKFTMKATIPDTPFGNIALGIILTAYFKMNVDVTTKYNKISY